MEILKDVIPPLGRDPEDHTRVRSKAFPHCLVLDNCASTARDHLANERTYLSWLRLSITLSIVSLAIIVSFHLRATPTRLEQQMAVPLGTLFWALALLTLASGAANYSNTVKGYAARKAVVETGPKTVIVFCIVSIAIIAVCVLLISTGASSREGG